MHRRILPMPIVEWQRSLGYAIPIASFIVGLFYYWFALANRCVIFLYGHMRSTPFDRRTISRYWMAGLVASGMVMVLYTFWNWLLGRIASWHEAFDYQPPAWWRVWLVSALPVAVGIFVITTTVNQPTLPMNIAVWCVLVTLVGLALSLTPGTVAATRPAEMIGLAGAGIGLLPCFLLLRVVALPADELSVGSIAYVVAIGSVVMGTVWSVIVGRWYTHKFESSWRVHDLLVSGVCWSYLLMPLVHYVFFTPSAYRYITASANFFTSNLLVQLMTLLAGVLLSTIVINLSGIDCFANYQRRKVG